MVDRGPGRNEAAGLPGADGDRDAVVIEGDVVVAVGIGVADAAGDGGAGLGGNNRPVRRPKRLISVVQSKLCRFVYKYMPNPDRCSRLHCQPVRQRLQCRR